MAWGNRLPWDIDIPRFDHLPSYYGLAANGAAPAGWTSSGGELAIVTGAVNYHSIDPSPPASTSPQTLEWEAMVVANPGTNLFGSYFSFGNTTRYVDIGHYTTLLRINDNGTNYDQAVDLTSWKRVRATIDGTTFNLYVNDVLIYTRTILRAASVGLVHFGQGSAGTGNWKVRSLRYSKLGAYAPPGPESIVGPGVYGYSQYGGGAAPSVTSGPPPLSFTITANSPTTGSVGAASRPVSTVIPNSSDSSAMQIQWEWDDDPTFANANGRKQTLTTLGNVDEVSSPGQPPSALAVDVIYYWRARAGNGVLWSSWTTSRTIKYSLKQTDAVIWTYINAGFEALTANREALEWAYADFGFNLVASGEAVVWVYVGDVDTSVPIPHIWFLRPTVGREGDGFSIYGHGFGSTDLVYNGHAYLNAIQLSETAWVQVAAGANAYNSLREIDPISGEPTMEHGRIDVTVPSGAASGPVRVETNI